MSKHRTIPITVDKSHLITIGERLYAQSLELIRELVSNAHDADATHVWIDLTPYTLTVKDNGSGMDEAGLRQYFNIGSQEKRHNKKSPLFGRKRIGEFGIGKFSVLSACDVFKLTTQKGSFCARVTFDKNLWNNVEGWELPVDYPKPSPHAGDGTTILLERLKKVPTLPEIERFIRERIPLKMPNFVIYLDGQAIKSKFIAGQKFPILRQTNFGEVRGEIILPNFPKMLEDSSKGIDIFVNDIFVKKESFGFEYSHSLAANRLIGEIHANFLQITSDRSRFIVDTPEYKEFDRIMRQEINTLLKELKAKAGLKAMEKADHVLKDALNHIRKGLKKNPRFAPEKQLDVGVEKEKEPSLFEPLESEDESGATSEREHGGLEQNEKQGAEGEGHGEDGAGQGGGGAEAKADRKKKPASRKVRVKTLTGNEIVARKMRIGSFNVVCHAAQLGENSEPVITENGIIFINRDHPLYKRFAKNVEALTLFVTQLIAQEIARQKITNVDEAFLLKNQILTDSWG